MNKIKDIRKAARLSQADLAKELGTSQQSVARWENGKAEPNIEMLHKMSLLFGTSIDDLLGRHFLNDRPMSTSFCVGSDDTVDKWWGYIGVKLPQADKSIWYPVTVGEACRVRTALNYPSSMNSWIYCKTLNNRFLLINLRNIHSVLLLDDNANPEDSNDWDLDWDSYQGYGLEVYRWLEDYLYDPSSMRDGAKQVAEFIIQDEKLSNEQIELKTQQTIAHFTGGSKKIIRVEEQMLWGVVQEVIGGEVPLKVFNLSNWGLGYDYFVNAQRVAMIDMPLCKLIDGQKEYVDQIVP